MPRATRARTAHRPTRSWLPATAALAVGAATAAVAVVGLNSGGAAQAATTWPAHVFAPFVDTGLSNTTLTSVASQEGTRYFTLAFESGAGCQASLPGQSGWQSQVSALQAAGGDVSISFGGYTVDTDGQDLGAQCSSASAMATQVESVVTTFNVSHLDFDIESSEETNQGDLTLTAQALAQVRSWASSTGRHLVLSYTIPVLPTGLDSSGLNVISTAKANGFTPDVVDIMAMDYGTSGTEMGTAADQAIDATAGQLESLYAISASSAYGMLGVTPMIGQNDTPGEILTTADASTVESYAASRGLALLSMWAEGRDNGGCPNSGTASSTCSGVTQSAYQFTAAFQPFTTGGSTGGGGSAPPPSSPPPSSPPPSGGNGSCAAAWSPSGTYTSGNEVSYNGENWTASQWSYDEVPGGPAGAWNSDGAC